MYRTHLARLLLVAVLVTVAGGCASAAGQVLTERNRYHYALAEYEARCGGTDNPDCRAWYDDIKAYKTRIEAAEAAVKRGGRLPLQLRAMKSAGKAALR